VVVCAVLNGEMKTTLVDIPRVDDAAGEAGGAKSKKKFGGLANQVEGEGDLMSRSSSSWVLEMSLDVV
jgi:hypothetical protein